MDPDVALARLIAAAVKGDVAEFPHHYHALKEWFLRGGFPPDGADSQEFRALAMARSIQQGEYDDYLGHLVTAVTKRAKELAPNLVPGHDPQTCPLGRELLERD